MPEPKKSFWNLTSATPPWHNGESIYRFIQKHLRPNGELDDADSRLPDEIDDDRIKFVAGGLDSLIAGGTNTDRVKLIYRALQVVLEDAAPTKLARFYEQLLQQGVIEFIDPLMDEILKRKDLDPQRLERLAGWIAQNSPDREPIKFALAVLGIVRSSKYDSVIAILGRHEEFTLYSVVAFSNNGDKDTEAKIFDLAKHVHGWGRIHAVHRLADTKNPEIQAWFLREGYKNYILYEYLAYTCAMAGGLRRELEKPSVDPELLLGAAEILQALFVGGPAEDMSDYDDGPLVAERYLHHLGDTPQDIRHLKTIDSIEEYLEDDSELQERTEQGWTPKVRDKLLWRVKALKASPHWIPLIFNGLESSNEYTFHQASIAARILNIDIWPYHFARLELGYFDEWYYVMQTRDNERIDRVLAFAEKVFPLNKIASGPTTTLGFGPQWKAHNQLDFILQELRHFPGKGWPLLQAGLRSPLIRNRHMSLQALSEWGKTNWPADAESCLQAALSAEIDDKLRNKFTAVLEGREDNADDDDEDDDDGDESS